MRVENKYKACVTCVLREMVTVAKLVYTKGDNIMDKEVKTREGKDERVGKL